MIITMRLSRNFYDKHEFQNPRNPKNLTLGDEAPKVMWAPLRQVSTSTS